MYDLKNCTAFSLTLDDSTNIQVVPQLTAFIRYVSAEVNVK